MEAARANCHLNTQANMKKLAFGPSKCMKLHIGKNDILCQDSPIDTWVLCREEDEDIRTLFEMADTEGDRHLIEKVLSLVYLGDICQSDGKHDINIKQRKTRGWWLSRYTAD